MTALFCCNPTTSEAGTVTVENTGLGGVTVVLSGMSDATTATDMNGQYAFTGLRSGTYSVEISGFDMDEVGFGNTSSAATVGVGESKVISFDGTYLRTAGIMGQVSVEGVGLAGVIVTMTGEGEDKTDVTDAGGLYAFSKLKAGAYSVAISGYDPDEVEFATTSMNVSVALGETANVPFDGTLLRTSGISGRVSVEGMGLDNVEVVLAGAAEATAMTSGGGQYAFAGLSEGTYVVSMMNPNETAYAFEMTSHTVELGDAESAIRNFDGTHTRTASVSGIAFIDEAPADKMYTANEPALPHAGIPVVLQGPGVNDVMLTVTDATGAYMFSDLMAGSYRALVNMTPEVAATIAAAGFAYKGDLTGETVSVEAGGNMSVNLPFGITMQTIGVGARMGYGEHLGVPVAGVKLSVYANADMTGMLGEGTTDEMGVAAVTFARADNTGPGGNDNLIFVNVSESGHDDLAVSDNSVIEVSYPAVARVHAAPAAVTLVNTRANFQYWVKNNETARGGDMGLEGWATDIYMGDPTAEGAMPLEDGPEDTDENGKATFTYKIPKEMLAGAAFTVMVAGDQSSEMYDQSDALVHMHNALAHPAMNTMEMNDLGPVRVTWTTQKLTVGVYREVDDEPGFTDYRAPMGGDRRPVEAVAGEMTAQLLTRDTRNRLRAYEYDHDGKASTDDISSMAIGKTGMASFPHLPADMKFTVRLHVGSDRMLVGETDSGDIESFGDDLDIGMSTGSFGAASGAGPEVKLCSVSTDAEKCATWAYQWETGSVSGSVAGAGGASVSLTAETDADDRGTKTGDNDKKDSYRQFSISDIQDGEYTLTTPNTADNKFSPRGGFELAIYHDETEDDEDDDTEYVGTAWSMSGADFTATKLRQSIKGFVANESGDGQVRGDEAMADVEVKLLEIAKDGVSKDKKDTTFSEVESTNTASNGFYEFNGLTEGDEYFVQVTAGDDYVGLAGKPGNNKSGPHEPDTYPTLYEGTDIFPYWSRSGATAGNTSVTVSNSDGSVSADLVNFALVYTDGAVGGRVTNLSGSNAGIIVELTMCDSFTRATATEAADCDWGSLRRTTTNSRGNFQFDGLMEGYYQMWWTGGGLATVMYSVDADGNATIDAGGALSWRTTSFPDLGGRRDYDGTGNTFFVYNLNAGSDTELDEVTVTGTTATEEDAEAEGVVGQDNVTGISMEITWAAESVTVDAAAADDDASVSVGAFDGTADDADRRACKDGVCTISFDPTDGTDPGETTIEITVTADNGYHDAVYTLTGVKRTNPAGNSLVARDFDVEDPADAEVEKAPGRVDQFTINVDEATTDLTFTVTLEDIDKQDLVVELGGKKQEPASRDDDDDDNEVRYEVELSAGANTIDLMVTSEDGEDREHQLVVRRDGRSSDATLSDLRLSAGELSPDFDAATTSYTARVANAVSSVRVTAEANHADASVAYDPGRTVNLNVGPNTITVTVTAEDGTEGDYTVRVTREAPGASSDATLSSLRLSAGELSPTFDPGMTTYMARVGNDVDEIKVTAVANDVDGANVVINPAQPSALVVGENEITVTVTAEDASTTKDYTVTVTRAPRGLSSDATLSALSLTPGALSPAFDPNVTTYTASVGNTVTEVMVMATASHDSASVGQDLDNPVPLDVGATPITVTVTAEAGNTKDYTVTVTRAPRGLSSDATLSALRLSAGELSPAFDPAMLEYTASVAHDVDEIEVTAVANDVDSANVVIDPAQPSALVVGENEITVTVTAEDGNTQDYTVTVTRAEPQSNDATLSTLSLNGGDVRLNEPWAATTYNYTANVENSVETAMVAATATDADGATVELPDPNPVALAVGDQNVITVTVTAEDRTTTKTYTVTVTREAPASNADPTITNGARQDLDENTKSVVTLAATDDDDDAITGFAVVEKAGSDHAAFDIDADNGLAFKEAPDHESPTDVGGDASGDNIYYVTVEVTSGTGDRERTAEQMFIVTVNDVDEAPSAPDAPMVEGASTTSLSVSWDAPANSGPAIVDYNLQHRVLTDPVGGAWTEMNDISETTATVTGLDEGTEYEVQVNAYNGEGTSEWSASGSGSTDVADVPDIDVSTDELTVREGEDAVYTIALATEPAGDVTVTVTVDQDLDAAGASVTPGEVTFTPSNWSRARQIVVAVAQNTNAAADVEGKIMHSAASPDDADYVIDDGPEIAMTVIDDDRNADAGIVLSETALTVEEGDTEGETYTIKLAAEPSGVVTVTVAGFADNDVTASPASLSFNADDWDEAQDVTVTAEEDDDAIANDVVMLTHTAAGADYVGVSERTVAVTITDDDVAGVTVSASALEIREGGSATYTVVLTAEPEVEPVTVSITSGNPDIWTNLSSLTFNRTNWNAAQTVTVNGRQDTDDPEADDAGTLVQAVTSSGDDYNSSTGEGVPGIVGGTPEGEENRGGSRGPDSRLESGSENPNRRPPR